jgi:hypothetical protein
MQNIKRLSILSIITFLILTSCRNQEKSLDGLKWQVLMDTIENDENEFGTSIWIDSEIIKKLPPSKKAVLAYISSLVGNECKRVETFEEQFVETDEYHLRCELTSALGLGYQCEEAHLEYLRNWFKEDSLTLEELEDCYMIPWTATVQTRINQLKLATEGDKIYVFLHAEGVNFSENLNWEWEQILIFKEKANSLIRIDIRDPNKGI